MNKNIQLPSHFRFLNETDAAGFGCTTKQWIPISSIETHGSNTYWDISAASFAWVEYNVQNPNLIFTHKNFTKKDLKKFEEE
jgi:hypothetical protein